MEILNRLASIIARVLQSPPMTTEAIVKKSIHRYAAEVRAISRISFPESTKKTFQIPDLRRRSVAEVVLKSIGRKQTNIIYAIRIRDSSLSIDAISKRFGRWKEKNSKAIHASMNNTQNINKNKSGTLYVGSSRSGFRDRMRKHIGTTNTRTYAMHLKEWLKSTPGHIEVEYFTFEDKVSHLQLQVIEDSLWDYYSPIFGKKGAH